MKKIILLLVAFFAFLSASLAQITQTASDSIVLERMQTETREHTVYAKKEVQTEGVSIATSMNEVLELDYPSWVYYIHYADQAEETAASRRYLVVKESNGNVLEVKTKNDAIPNNSEAWRIIPEEPQVRLSWTGEFNCEHYPLDSVVITNRSNGKRAVFCYPDTVYTNGKIEIGKNIPFQYGDELIMRGISRKDAFFQYKNEYRHILLTEDTLITFTFFDEQSFVDTSEVTVIESLLGTGSRCYYNAFPIPSLDCYRGNFLIIDTQSDLDSLFVCNSLLVPPIIDFSTQSLILMRGWTPDQVGPGTFSFIKNCSGNYVILIDIFFYGGQTTPSTYSWMVIVNEVIQNKEQIKLIVNYAGERLCY